MRVYQHYIQFYSLIDVSWEIISYYLQTSCTQSVQSEVECYIYACLCGDNMISMCHVSRRVPRWALRPSQAFDLTTKWYCVDQWRLVSDLDFSSFVTCIIWQQLIATPNQWHQPVFHSIALFHNQWDQPVFHSTDLLLANGIGQSFTLLLYT